MERHSTKAVTKTLECKPRSDQTSCQVVCAAPSLFMHRRRLEKTEVNQISEVYMKYYSSFYLQRREITWPPVCPGDSYLKQRTRGERKSPNIKLFIETNSVQEKQYLVRLAANGRRCRNSPRLELGGTAGPLSADRMVHSVGSLQEARHQRHTDTHTYVDTLR